MAWKIYPRWAVASTSYSATTDLVTDFTCQNGYTQSQARVEVSIPSAAFVSLITKTSLATVIASAMLLPKTGSAALTANILYTLHHEMRNNRLYNYQLSAITGSAGNINLIVDEIVEGQFYT